MSQIRRRFLGRVAVVTFLCVATVGCAVVYDDSDGTKHIMGLANVEVRPPGSGVTIAGDVIDVKIIGLGIYMTQAYSGVVVGYSREISAAVRDNALVLGNPLQTI